MPEDPRIVRALYWATQLGAWGWHFWWQASGEAIFAGVPFSKAATVWGGACVTGIVTTDLLRRLSKRWAWLELSTGALVRRLLMSVAVLTVIGYGATIALSIAVYGSPVTAIAQAFYRQVPFSTRMFNELLPLLVIYLAWVAAYFSVALIRLRDRVELQRAHLSESLQAAELRLLKSQLNPHFLFNALNGVRALVEDEPSRAQDAVTQLARMLRYLLASGREELVTLARELEMVDDYLALESLRFTERLRVVRDIDPRTTSTRIPVMLLQTLVENAIKHGIAPLREGGSLRIAARTVDTAVEIEVEHPRPVAPNARQPTDGVGLENTARRLELLFGARASLCLDLSNTGRAKATARVPL